MATPFQSSNVQTSASQNAPAGQFQTPAAPSATAVNNRSASTSVTPPTVTPPVIQKSAPTPIGSPIQQQPVTQTQPSLLNSVLGIPKAEAAPPSTSAAPMPPPSPIPEGPSPTGFKLTPSTLQGWLNNGRITPQEAFAAAKSVDQNFAAGTEKMSADAQAKGLPYGNDPAFIARAFKAAYGVGSPSSTTPDMTALMDALRKSNTPTPIPEAPVNTDSTNIPPAMGTHYATPKTDATNPSILNNIGNDVMNRNNQVFGQNGALSRLITGQQGIGETALQIGGAGAGEINDIVGEGIGAAAKGLWHIAPEAIKQPLGNMAKSFAQSPVVQSGLHAISQGKAVYDQWAASNPAQAADLGSIVNIGMLLPIGKGVELADKGVQAASDSVSPLLYKTGQAASDSLKTSAENSVQKALGATTNALKATAAKISPEILTRPMSDTFALTRAGLEKKASAGVEKAGQAIQDFGKLSGSTPTKNIIDAIEQEKAPFIAGGKVIDQGAVDHLSQMQDLFKQYGKSVDNDTLRDALRIISSKVAGKSGNGFATSLEDGSRIDAMKTASNVVRGILADTHPDLAKLNKEYTFWKNFQKVISATNTRTASQSGIMDKAAGAMGAVVGGHAGPAGVVEGFTAGKYLSAVLQSPAWRLTSARIKNNIADAIGYGDNTALKEALDEATKQDPKFDSFRNSPTLSTPEQSSQEGGKVGTSAGSVLP